MIACIRTCALFFAGMLSLAAFGAPVDQVRPLLTIKYRHDGHLILLAVRVNGRGPVWFCLDSGAPHTVIDPTLATKLKLRILDRNLTTGTGSGNVEVAHSEPVTLRLGRVRLHVKEPWVIDLKDVPIAKDVKGLLGADLFRNYIVRIDPTASEVSLFDPTSFSLSKMGTTLPLYFENDRLFIDASLDVKPGLTVTHRVRIDTGAEVSISDPIVAQSTETKTTTLGNGLGANFEGVSGVFDAVHVGPYTLRHVWGPGGPQMIIGMEILRRFTTTFDTRRGLLHLVPNRSLVEPVPEPKS